MYSCYCATTTTTSTTTVSLNYLSFYDGIIFVYINMIFFSLLNIQLIRYILKLKEHVQFL